MKAILFFLVCIHCIAHRSSFKLHTTTTATTCSSRARVEYTSRLSAYTAADSPPMNQEPEGPPRAVSQRLDLINTGSVMTLSRFMIEATRANPHHADFESLFESTQLACKTISNQLKRAGIDYDLVSPRDEHSTVRNKEEMFNMAATVLKNSLRFTGKIGVAVQDGEDPVLIEESWNSPYVVRTSDAPLHSTTPSHPSVNHFHTIKITTSHQKAVFDPLDGSDNIDAGIVTGTIFSIFKQEEPCLVDFGEGNSFTDQ
jgi:hypothetical protein